METLGAIAIIVILLAVATVSIINIRETLEFRQMNDYAREVYMAAQSQLTALKTQGRLGELQNAAGTVRPTQ